MTLNPNTPAFLKLDGRNYVLQKPDLNRQIFSSSAELSSTISRFTRAHPDLHYVQVEKPGGVALYVEVCRSCGKGI